MFSFLYSLHILFSTHASLIALLMFGDLCVCIAYTYAVYPFCLSYLYFFLSSYEGIRRYKHVFTFQQGLHTVNVEYIRSCIFMIMNLGALFFIQLLFNGPRPDSHQTRNFSGIKIPQLNFYRFHLYHPSYLFSHILHQIHV